MTSELDLRAALNAEMEALGPNPTREQLQAACVEVLAKHMPKPEVDQLSVDPDGTLRFTMKWV